MTTLTIHPKPLLNPQPYPHSTDPISSAFGFGLLARGGLFASRVSGFAVQALGFSGFLVVFFFCRALRFRV